MSFMSTIATAAGMTEARQLTAIIIGGLAFTAIFAWMILRFVRSIEDPRKVRRSLIILGLLYVFCAINVVVEVARGRESATILIALPIGLFFAWRYLRAASKIQVPRK